MRATEIIRVALLLIHSKSGILPINSFSPKSSHVHLRPTCTTITSSSSSSTLLRGGTGKTNDYAWREEQFEIEIKVQVPPLTKAKAISYKGKSKSIHLTLGDKVLLDGSREMRGMIDLDGTFWSIVDSEEHDGRDVIITIEKMSTPPKDTFEVVDFDWGGIYPDDDEEILEKHYDEPETLDIKEYAASLGVDIDNINMDMVDKSMFSSGLNMTRNTMEELTKSGYVKEVTSQNDGTETIDNANSQGESVPFQSLGPNISDDEIRDAGIRNTEGGSRGNGNPFMDKNSPWLQSMPAEEVRGVEGQNAKPAEDDAVKATKEAEPEPRGPGAQDPIDLLTVTKLKEVLRKEGLKVSGNKQELQDRLKTHIRSVMETKKEQGEGED